MSRDIANAYVLASQPEPLRVRQAQSLHVPSWAILFARKNGVSV
jgi:hypothetical protein